eukprot:403341845
MGNSDSKKAFTKGSLLVTLDSKEVRSGMNITGTVSYQLEEDYPAEQITLELIGKEKVTWDDLQRTRRHSFSHQQQNHVVHSYDENLSNLNHSIHSSSTYSKTHNSKTTKADQTYAVKRVFIHLHKLVYKFPQAGKNKGQQAFKFQMQIPHDMPSSFLFVGQKDSRIQIQYKLIAKMEDTSNKKKGGYLPLLSKRLVIVQHPPEEIKFDQSFLKSHDMKNLFFFKAGTAKALAFIEKDAYQQSQTIKLRLELDNTQCEQELKKVRVNFMREITATAADRLKFQDKQALLERSVQGVQSKVSDSRDIDLPLSLINFLNDKYVKRLCEKKQYLEQELKDWLFSLQPSLPPYNPYQANQDPRAIQVNNQNPSANFGNNNPHYNPNFLPHQGNLPQVLPPIDQQQHNHQQILNQQHQLFQQLQYNQQQYLQQLDYEIPVGQPVVLNPAVNQKNKLIAGNDELNDRLQEDDDQVFANPQDQQNSRFEEINKSKQPKQI